MKINLKRVCIFASLILVAMTLHLQHQQQGYDNQRYFDSMQQKQTKLKQDLANIQAMFKQLDTSLTQSVTNPDEQLRILNEGLADERDSLYAIQQYLNLPLNERQCQCFNFTQAKKDQIRQQLDKVRQSIANIQSETQQCSDCAMVVEIKREIQQQKAYLQTMQDTLNAKCCIKYNYWYQDNLQGPNWYYGNLTAQQYTQIMQDFKNAAPEDTIVKICPISSPYARPDFRGCMACPNAEQIFNLNTRQCEQCPVGKKFNYQKKQCVFDRNCQAGTILNEQTGECQKVQPAYNSSSCPKDRPIWNPLVYACFKCPVQTPYYNQQNKNCEGCPQDYIFNQRVGQCVHQSCNSNQVYDPSTGTCKLKDINTGTHSNCPLQRPYWNQVSLTCVQCPDSTPYYNPQTIKCQACGQGLQYAPIYGHCLPQCKPGEVLSHNTWKCQNITQPIPQKPSNPGDSSICPPDRPIWNSNSLSCQLCPASQPHWNSITGKCSKCSSDTTWNQQTKQCEGQQVVCPEGQTLNVQTGQCQSPDQNGSLGLCPPDRPYYNKIDFSCSQCPVDKPYYNSTSGSCQTQPVSTVQPTPQPQPSSQLNGTIGMCSPDQIYDPNIRACIARQKPAQPAPQPTPQPQPQPTNGSYTGVCPPEKPIWDSSLMICTPCSKGQAWNNIQKQCKPCATLDCAPVIVTVCDINQQFNKTTNKCQPCQTWQLYNATTSICDKVCNLGQIYEPSTGICHGTISYCNPGTIYDPKEMRCRCKQGDNYDFDVNLDYCVKKCENNQYYDTISKKCINK